MNKAAFLAVLLALVMLGACTKRSKQRAVVEEWVGKELIMPDELTFQIQDIPINYDFNNADFKIVTYIDSTGCTNCKMKLPLWDKVINELKVDVDTDVNFLMIVGSNDLGGVKRILRENNFNHPVSLDTLNMFDKTNGLPQNEEYHTFLMNRNNQVLTIGNPVTNPKLLRLYKNIIFSSNKDKQEANISNISKVNDSRIQVKSVGSVHTGDTISLRYK